MAVLITADRFVEDMEAQEFGAMLAFIAQSFHGDNEGFSIFVQEAADAALNHHSFPEEGTLSAADYIVGYLEKSAIRCLEKNDSA